MKKIVELITAEVAKAFVAAEYDASYAKVTLSNRPDLCEYQCNGAMAAAKVYRKSPLAIAGEIVEKMQENQVFSEVAAVAPGFINIRLEAGFLTAYLQKMQADEHLSVTQAVPPKKIMIDYGGPNVAKPLHVGHLRSAIIGESIKRMGRFLGHEMIGDVHLGDWGLQMGLIITELKERKPELVYFDEIFTGTYPQEAPFTIGELEEIYPAASAKSKEDATFKEAAMQATFQLQQGHRGYQGILSHILEVSVTDLKKNYERLGVTFELWKGESDVQHYVPEMIEEMKKEGYARLDAGAWVVDVKEECDTKEIPPCIILKSDGASLYTTTDLATLIERMELFHPDEIIYVVDKRQDMHFTQVFRCARKTKLVNEDTGLRFLGFGTMNGKDGKPFKTREGGIMRLENLISDINEEMYRKITENHEIDPDEARVTATTVGLSALKYGDLSNQAAKDYVFDIDRFTSFEGNTGPYILYTIVRIKSILTKYQNSGAVSDTAVIGNPVSISEKALMLVLANFNGVVENAFEEIAPHKICSYTYDLANAFNRFYHETKILAETDEGQKASWIRLLLLTKNVLECSIDLLGFTSPERM